jgi:hypothetical protein
MKANSTILECKFLDGIVSGAWCSCWSAERKAKALRHYADIALIRKWDVDVCAKTVRSYAMVLAGKLNNAPRKD